jgi:dipeptidase
MTWKVDGETYFNERAISTQQTGFSFLAQSRSWLPAPIGGILWFGVDDTYYTVYTPMYCGITEVPESFAVGNGDMMTFSDNAAFWVFNQVTNFVYSRTSVMIDDLKAKQKALESFYLSDVANVDKYASALYSNNQAAAIKYITDYSVGAGKATVDEWKKLYAFLFTKYMDGNIKTSQPVPAGYNRVNPKVSQPGYTEEWNKFVAKSTGDRYKQK